MELATTGRALLDFEFQEDLRRYMRKTPGGGTTAAELTKPSAPERRGSTASADDEERTLTTQLINKLGNQPQIVPAPFQQQSRPVSSTEETAVRQFDELPAEVSELPPSLSRRPRQARPLAAQRPPGLDRQPAEGSLQLPLIGGQHSRRSQHGPPVRSSNSGRLAALRSGFRPPGLIRLSETDDQDGIRLARLSLERRATASRLLLESANDEGRSGAGAAVKENSSAARPFTAAADSASRRQSTAVSHTRFAVINGQTRTEAPDFYSFRRIYHDHWSRTASGVQRMEKFLRAYSVPVAFVNGEKLAALSEAIEQDGLRPTVAQLLDCLINRSDAAKLVSQPGRRFAGAGGPVKASIVIQAYWRGFLQWRRFQELRRRRRAAGIIAVHWLVHLRLRALRSRLLESRASHLEGYGRRLQQLAKCWNDWQKQRRVVIHIPSLGYLQTVRQRLKSLDQLQNTQMARLCDMRDPNVNVVLLCPLPIGAELTQYYSRLAALQTAIQSGKAEDQSDASQRFRIVVPEAVGQFPQHNLCLSTLLNYSPVALRQIREIVNGRRAYIVPGLPCADDLAVADKLDVPILCPEPSLVRKFSSGSGSRDLLLTAQLPVPPGEAGIVSLPQLAEVLARLITADLDVKRWRLRINGFPPASSSSPDEFGAASLEPERLACYQWALDERRRFGDKWSRLWAQERVYLKMLDELQSTALPQQTSPEFLAELSICGGSVEAQPNSEDAALITVTVALCVEPTGFVRIVSSGDRPHTAMGPTCVPQTTLPASVLAEFCRRLGTACVERRLFGHLSIDFLVFGVKPNMTIWATDLRLQYSDTAALTQLLQFASNSSLDPVTHAFVSAPRSRVGAGAPSTRTRPKTAAASVGLGVGMRRFAAMSSGLCHSGLTTIDYAVFFQLCKARGIGFDVTDLTGTLFCLVDSVRRDRICVLTVADAPERARREFLRVLAAIDDEVGAKAPSNFARFHCNEAAS